MQNVRALSILRFEAETTQPPPVEIIHPLQVEFRIFSRYLVSCSRKNFSPWFLNICDTESFSVFSISSSRSKKGLPNFLASSLPTLVFPVHIKPTMHIGTTASLIIIAVKKQNGGCLITPAAPIRSRFGSVVRNYGTRQSGGHYVLTDAGGIANRVFNRFRRGKP